MKNKNEGTCGHGPGGKLGKTPGGTKGMSANKRTNDMLNLKEFIRQEIAKLKEFKMYKAIDSKGGETIFPDKDDTSALKKKQASNVTDVKPLDKP